MRDGSFCFVAVDVVVDQDKFVSFDELNRIVLEHAEPHFGPLRVQNQRNNFSLRLGGRFHRVNAFFVPRVVAVREVEAGAVHAVFDKPFDDARRVGGRSLRANDFRLFKHCSTSSKFFPLYNTLRLGQSCWKKIFGGEILAGFIR